MRPALRRLLPWLAILATLGLGVATLVDALTQPARFAGFLAYRSGAVAPLHRRGWEARAQGVAVRQTVVAVDGQAVHGGAELRDRLAALPLGAPVTIGLRGADDGDGAAPRTVVRLHVARIAGADLAYTFVLPFSIGLLYLLLGSFIYLMKRDGVARLALALCLVAATFYLTMYDAHTAYRYTRLWSIYPLLGPLSVHLFAVFPEERPAWHRARTLAPLYLVAVAIIAWRQLALDRPHAADLSSLSSAIALAVEFLVDLALLGTAFRRGRSPAVRKRAKTIFVGMALSMSVVIAWQFAARTGSALTADEAMICSAAFPLLIAYAILRRDVFDIDAVLRASLIYALATALVVGLYFAIVAVVGAVTAPLLGKLAEAAPHAVAAGATLVAAVAFHPLRLRVQRIVDRVLGVDRRAVAEQLAALAGALPAAGDVPAVADEVARRLAELVAAREVAILVPDRRGGELDLIAEHGARAAARRENASLRVPLGGALGRALGERESGALAVRDLGAEAAVELQPLVVRLGCELLMPLRARGRLLAVAAIGPRRSGIYRFAELRALERAAAPIALALENAVLLTERAARERLAALGSLAAVIVHEVKNPLGIIKVSAGSLRRHAADDSSDELARCIEAEVDRMDATCRRLLELARPPEPQLVPCRLAPLVQATVDRIAPELDAAGVRVDCRLVDVPPTLADPDALAGALFNLLANARDAVSPGAGRVEVTLAENGTQGTVEMIVSDNGRGMDEPTRRQLFRPFFTTRHGGTGLGLAIVKRVVEEHGGAIHVESQPGAGARFTMTLPLRT